MSGRSIVAAVVLAAWGAGIAVFAQREMSRSERDRLATAAVRIAPVASYFAASREGRHVGFVSFTTDTVPDGLQFTEYSVRDLSSGSPQRRETRQLVARTSRALALREVVVSNGRSIARAAVIDDSSLAIVVERAGGADTARTRFRPPLLVPSLVPLVVALGEGTSTGDRRAFDVLDPLTLRVRRASVMVRAESSWVVVDSAAWDGSSSRWRGAHVDTVRAWRVVEDDSAGIDAWVDELGQVVDARDTEGVSLRRTAYELAFENWRNAGRDVREPGVRDASRPTRPTTPLQQLVLRVRGLPLDRLAAASERQQVAGDTLRVEVRMRGGPNGYWLPPQRDFRRQFLRELQVEPGLEVDAPAIVATAQRIRGRESDPRALAATLTRWVADSITFDSTLTPPGALAALRSRTGDADQHVLLFVALARAAGIPARPVRGLLYSNDRLRPHAWAEAFLGGDWLPLDPTTGQFRVDAHHVRLLVGGMGAREEFERLVQHAAVEVLSTVAAHQRPRPNRP